MSASSRPFIMHRRVTITGEARSSTGWRPACLEMTDIPLRWALAEAARCRIDRISSVSIDGRAIKT